MLCFKNGQFILYSLFYIFPFCNHAAITFVTQYIPGGGRKKMDTKLRQILQAGLPPTWF